MIISKTEPYERNIQTFVKWKMSKNLLSAKFKRDGKTENIRWAETQEIKADKICLLDLTNEWNAEVQAMTKYKFHLQVNSNTGSSVILYSGLVEKVNPMLRIFDIFL
ncbi:hypothetical protein EHQ58_13945 [Leptospira ognonensis]|uniref:Uncharacterized protein n=2 Tax=Leptospira ognonensis TaxID=2484945 RepID=A0A4R9K052_9LEPT|nr:hypothetical protein EHQ58_13945 [Leptospira ognonensis]